MLVSFMEKDSLWKYSMVAKNFAKLAGEDMKEVRSNAKIN